jgi:transmembrane protein 17
MLPACIFLDNYFHFDLFSQVPELAGFWLLTLLLQTPLTLFLLLNGDTIILPLERAVHIIMAIFVICEIFMGYFAIRALVNHQVTKFHLQQFTNLEQIDPEEYLQQQARQRHEHRA